MQDDLSDGGGPQDISKEKGEQVLFDDQRYFFYITNERRDRFRHCLFRQRSLQPGELAGPVKGGCHALHAPVDNLESNWAYMLMTALAWNLKAWWALSLPALPGRWQAKHQAEKQSVLKMEIQGISQCLCLAALPDHPDGPQVGLSLVGLES